MQLPASARSGGPLLHRIRLLQLPMARSVTSKKMYAWLLAKMLWLCRSAIV